GGAGGTSINVATGSVGGAGGSSWIDGVNDGKTIGGNGSMPNPEGGDMIGRTGNGHARITNMVPPVEKELVLVGNSTITIGLGSNFTDPGIELIRNNEVIPPTNTITVTNTLNTNIAGTYTITYSYTSAETGGTYTAIRTIHVISSVINLGFTGTIQQVTLEPGIYRLETWGAQRREHKRRPWWFCFRNIYSGR
ncbi:MAG: DUF5011 domain-containing protein, partial [Oscillospiraceae bacterium]|nr:DUF5011 domain-containing protein [Oscillospiraceae bacterium]